MSIIKRIFKNLAVLALIGGAVGCSSPTGSYQSFNEYKKPIYGKLASKTVAYEGIARNPVIVVHGFLGSKLVDMKTGKNIWGSFKGSDNFGSFPSEEVRAFAHPMGIGKPLKELQSSAKPYGILDAVEVKFLGMDFRIDAYNSLINILKNAGYCQEGKPLPKNKSYYNLFLFYYDWRRDLPENAARLQEYIQSKREYIQKIYKKRYGINKYDVQFDVIAHSMGGLLARYYLRYGNRDLPKNGSLPKISWYGSKFIDKLLIVGTPNAGYLDTVIEMVKGLQVQPGTPTIPPGIVGTFPTYYQMMPPASTKSVIIAGDATEAGVDIFDPQVWIDMKWGLADPSQDSILKILLPNAKTPEERRKIALDHQAKCLKRAKQFTEAMKVKATPPDDVALFLFEGDAVLTSRQAEANKATGEIKVKRYEPGDGKILVTSAIFDERVGQPWVPYLVSPITWTAVYRLPAAHMGITRSEFFADNMTFCLLVTPTKAQAVRKKYFRRFYEMDKKK